jgi:hypothetical protein
MGIRRLASAHQQRPAVPPVPQSNATPQRPHAMRRTVQTGSGLSAFMTSSCNHAGMTALRQEVCGPEPPAMAAAAMNA